ncbi:hypothetical protein JZ751_022160 [Albula glossodonta]|uniref:Ig-like domain-containing protein n=1 Tax=Albula glossodonta TaxID=121402 RepID=A0A8T2MSY8_9TELE|nr:hypothetical protein JZ751_022160 [Albula glossodonta]
MVVPKPNFTGPYQRDTVLTCHFFFEQMVPPESISVNWWRNESGSQRIIYAFEHGRRQRPKEDPAYSYRTDLYYNLTLGDASLKIQDLCLKDTGLYVCEAWSEGYSSHGVGSVNLSVAVQEHSDPNQQVQGQTSDC